MLRTTLVVFALVIALQSLSVAGDDLQCLTDIYRMASRNASIAYPNGFMMIDYTGKAINDLGNFDQCLDLGQNIANYCLLEASTEAEVMSVTMYMGLCVPVSCDEQDLNGHLSDISDMSDTYPVLKLVNWTTASVHCHHPPEALSKPAIVTIVLICVVVVIVIVGTVLEGLSQIKKPAELKSVTVSGRPVNYQSIPDGADSSKDMPSHGINDGDSEKPKRDTKLVQFFKCFAIQPNLKFLFADNTQGGSSPLASLNGFRVTMMAWIILGHTMTYMIIPVGMDNELEIGQIWMKKMSFQVTAGAELAVDAFFYISGFLVMFMLLKELNVRKGKVSWGLFYFHRYWRLTPVFAFIMLIYTTLTPYMVTGPFSYLYRNAKTNLCVETWWSNLLYINNFWPKSSGAQCMGWTWFLANDMQFYLITPLLALVFRKSRVGAYVSVLTMIVLSTVLTWVLTAHYNLSPMNPNDDNFNSILYNKPYTRITPYLQGVLVAYMLQHEGVDLSAKRIVRYLGYAVAFGVTFSPVYLTTSFWEDGGHWPLIKNLFYNAFSRTSFVLGVMIVMYSLYKQHGFLLRKILSGWMWVFLARLTYTAYLLHPIIIFVQYFNSTRVFHMSVWDITVHYISNVVLAYCLGLVFHLAVEKPTANLERLFLPHKK